MKLVVNESAHFSQLLDLGPIAGNGVGMTNRPVIANVALAGIVQPIWILGGSAVVGALRPGYEPLRDAISELGERGAATSLAWNLGGFGVAALLYALYAVAVRVGLSDGWTFRLVALQAILLAGSGAFACDPGCPMVPRSTTMWLHTIFGLGYFATTTLLPLVAWRALRHRAEWQALSRASLGAGAILIVLFVVGPSLGEDRIGLWQRTFLVAAYAWQAAIAWHLSRLLRRSPPDPAPALAAGPPS